jgi:ribosomal subunit interface protein
MKLNITARHFKASPELTEAVENTVNNFGHFHDSIISTDVILEKEDQGQSVEFIVHVSGKTLVAKESETDLFKAMHGASDNIIRQIQKLKTKNGKAIHQ